MNAVPIVHEFPIGVVGYVLARPSADIHFCVFDPKKTQDARLREQAQADVRAAGGNCMMCSVACPFNLN